MVAGRKNEGGGVVKREGRPERKTNGAGSRKKRRLAPVSIIESVLIRRVQKLQRDRRKKMDSESPDSYQDNRDRHPPPVLGFASQQTR